MAVSVSSVLCRLLPDHIRQKAEKARPLDGARKLALLLRRDRGDAARHDLAPLGHVTLQQFHVLVVDLRCVGAGKRTRLAAAEERPAGRQLGKAHRSLLRRLDRFGLVARAATLTPLARFATIATIAAVASLITLAPFTVATALAAPLVAVAVAVDLAHHR